MKQMNCKNLKDAWYPWDAWPPTTEGGYLVWLDDKNIQYCPYLIQISIKDSIVDVDDEYLEKYLASGNSPTHFRPVFDPYGDQQ